MSSILTDLSFENIATYFTIYAMFNTHPNLEFLEILKFDLYRKCERETNYHALLLLANRIKGRKLAFKNYQAIGTPYETLSL